MKWLFQRIPNDSNVLVIRICQNLPKCLRNELTSSERRFFDKKRGRRLRLLVVPFGLVFNPFRQSSLDMVISGHLVTCHICFLYRVCFIPASSKPFATPWWSRRWLFQMLFQTLFRTLISQVLVLLFENFQFSAPYTFSLHFSITMILLVLALYQCMPALCLLLRPLRRIKDLLQTVVIRILIGDNYLQPY